MEIKLFIGLGNPGPEYKNTYHNVGQLFIDFLAGRNAKFKKEGHLEFTKSQELILIKTTTFMNHSGAAVLAAKKYFGCRPSELLVVHDDSDIPLGNFKLSFGRGSAGHQGVESVMKSLKTKRFPRLRIGIGKIRKTRKIKAERLVLKKILDRDNRVLKKVFNEITASLLPENKQ